MNRKLIKISEIHYIIVDDSEIRQGEWFYMYNPFGSVIDRCDDKSPFVAKSARYIWEHNGKKISHSFGIYLEGVENRPLSEVEELLFGHSIESAMQKIANQKIEEDNRIDINAYSHGIIDGLKAHKELTKDKLFTVEDMKKAMWEVDRLKTTNLSTEEFKKIVDKYLESILPKTEYNITFNENNKLVII